jgi:hypothetical protein
MKKHCDVQAVMVMCNWWNIWRENAERMCTQEMMLHFALQVNMTIWTWFSVWWTVEQMCTHRMKKHCGWQVKGPTWAW